MRAQAVDAVSHLDLVRLIFTPGAGGVGSPEKELGVQVLLATQASVTDEPP